VQFEGGAYYPAAIYLGGTGQTVVRAIDSDVAEMFRRAEVSASGGGNQGDGGITHTNAALAGGTAVGASLRVNLGPAAVVSAGRWKIGSSGTLRSSGYQQSGLIAPSVSLLFNAVSGFITPGLPSGSAISQALTPGVLTTVTAIYHGITAHPPDRAVTPLGSTTFTVSVSGTPTSYRWRRNGANLSNGVTANGTTVADATGATLTLSNIQLADAGSYSVVVTWDNGSRTSNAGTLEVQSAMSAWLSDYFTTEEQSDPLISGPNADPGKDGVCVLLAYALNLHPKNNDCRFMTPGTGTFGLPAATRRNVSGQTRLTLEFVRRRAASAPGITYRVEFTGNLPNSAAWASTGSETVVTIDSTWERVLVTDTQPATPARFGRLVVTQP
jgi:hypothetical protein